MSKLQCNLQLQLTYSYNINQNLIIFIQEMHLKMHATKMATIVSMGRIVESFGLNSPDAFHQEHLAKRSATTWTSYFGQHWDEFSLDHFRTTFVRIEVLEVYSTSNNGFIEVEFYTGISESSLIGLCGI